MSEPAMIVLIIFAAIILICLLVFSIPLIEKYNDRKKKKKESE